MSPPQLDGAVPPTTPLLVTPGSFVCDSGHRGGEKDQQDPETSHTHAGPWAPPTPISNVGMDTITVRIVSLVWKRLFIPQGAPGGSGPCGINLHAFAKISLRTPKLRKPLKKLLILIFTLIVTTIAVNC